MKSALAEDGYSVTNVVYQNAPPVTDAGYDQTVGAWDTVMLDASASSDPENNISHYLWEQTEGVRVSLSDPRAIQPTFIAPVTDESLTFRLTVTDTAGLQSSDTVTIQVTGETDKGYAVDSDIRIRAVIHTVEKGPIEAIWKKGGEDMTDRGDEVIWGYFYASPDEVSWGSEENPDLFVKIWFDADGRTDVNYFHVSVPEIDVCSDYLRDNNGIAMGTATMETRYIRQYYENGESRMDEKKEDGNPPEDDWLTGDPPGDFVADNLRIAAMIDTVEKGLTQAVWRKGGEDMTSGGHQVIWGHFYADPSDVNWGSRDNPELFVKIWFDAGGRLDVNYFHVSVPDIEVYSDFPDEGFYKEKGTTMLDNRYIRHEFRRW